MKLTILGKHPVPQAGFNGVMSLFEAKGFCRLGYDVTLAIPMADEAEHEAFLAGNQLRSIDDLGRFGGVFRIVPVFPDGRNFEECDICIYQSYDARDQELFFDLCRDRAKLLTKNFPKFVAGSGDIHSPNVKGQLAQFDLIACALREDYELFRADAQFMRDRGSSVAYVPRGASPNMLHPALKFGLPPTIGFDTPNSDDMRSVEHFVEPLKRLRRTFPDLRVLSLGKSLPSLDATPVPFGRFDRTYAQFFNQIHAYGIINYEFSTPHLQARVQKENPNWRHKAIYEVQNIEAQMSGAAIVGCEKNLIPELYDPGTTGFVFGDLADEEAIYRNLSFVLENRSQTVHSARRFALSRFSWDDAIESWHAALQRRWKILFG